MEQAVMSTERAMPAPTHGSRARSIALGACFWSAVAVVAMLPEMTVKHDFGKIALMSLVQWWSWGLLAPVILAVDERLPFSEPAACAQGARASRARAALRSGVWLPLGVRG